MRNIIPHLTGLETIVDGYTYKITYSTYYTGDIVGCFNGTSCWYSNANIEWPQWIQLDFGQTVFLSEIRFCAVDDAISVMTKDWEIQTSLDNISFTHYSSGTYEEGFRPLPGSTLIECYPDIISRKQVKARYVKILIKSMYQVRSYYNWVGLGNVRIYAPDPFYVYSNSFNKLYGM